MLVTQVYDLLNGITKEVLGDSVIVQEDLENVVDVGKAFQNLDGALDNYVRKLHDRIGKMVFVNRRYGGRAPSVLMDGWEYGAILAKIRADLPEAEENESWNLTDGASYDPNVFTAPKVESKFFNKKTTYEIPVSTVREQVISAFNSAAELNAFFSMIEMQVENSLTVKNDSLIMRTINSFMGDILHDEFSTAQYSSGSGVRAVNLLYLYNQTLAEADRLTASAAMTDPGFLRFSVAMIRKYIDRMQVMSTLFNVAGTQKFTPVDRMKVVLLSDYVRNAGVYLYDANGQFRTDNIRLPEAIDTVPYWQGSGTSYAFSDISKINLKTGSGNTVAHTPSMLRFSPLRNAQNFLNHFRF